MYFLWPSGIRKRTCLLLLTTSDFLCAWSHNIINSHIILDLDHKNLYLCALTRDSRIPFIFTPIPEYRRHGQRRIRCMYLLSPCQSHLLITALSSSFSKVPSLAFSTPKNISRYLPPNPTLMLLPHSRPHRRFRRREIQPALTFHPEWVQPRLQIHHRRRICNPLHPSRCQNHQSPDLGYSRPRTLPRHHKRLLPRCCRSAASLRYQ